MKKQMLVLSRWMMVMVMCMVMSQTALAKKPKLAGVLNLNTATAEQLKMLPRVGPKVARRILAYRAKAKKFSKIEEIMKVKGIGRKTFKKMKAHLTVEAKTTIRPATSQK